MASSNSSEGGKNWEYVHAQSAIWSNAEIFEYFGLARKS
jgi:hypothetical protein